MRYIEEAGFVVLDNRTGKTGEDTYATYRDKIDHEIVPLSEDLFIEADYCSLTKGEGGRSIHIAWPEAPAPEEPQATLEEPSGDDEQAIRVARRRIATLEQALELARRRISTLEHELRLRDEAISSLENQLRLRDEAISGLENELQLVRNTISAMEDSRTWRWGQRLACSWLGGVLRWIEKRLLRRKRGGPGASEAR